MKKRSNTFTTVILAFVFLTGLSLMLYPSVSDWWNSMHQSRIIANYENNLNNIDNETYMQLWEDAEDYNDRLAAGIAKESEYDAVLDPYGNGYMGYVEIPALGVKLPIAHGTDDSVLDKAVGHLEWTSLPIGGDSTHCVLSGHRGLPSAELLTNLDKLDPGDVFSLHILGDVLEYQVDAVNVVEPNDGSLLRVVEGMDYVTLLTCTPYGINSHRLLVRGQRIDREVISGNIEAQVATEVEPVSLFILVPLCLVGLSAAHLLFSKVFGKRKKSRKQDIPAA